MKDFYYPNEIGLFKVSLFDSCRKVNKYSDVSLINFLNGDLNKAFSERVNHMRTLLEQERFIQNFRLGWSIS